MKQVRLSPFHFRFLVFSWGALILSGFYWIGSRVSSGRPLFESTASYPLEFVSMKVHGGVAYLAVFCIGTFVLHIQQGWKTKVNRVSGIFICVTIFVLIFTGWGLYYFSSERVRDWSSVIHVSLGSLIGVFFAIHVGFLKLRRG